MNLGLGFLVLALHLPTGAKLNVLDISVCEQMDIVTNHPLRLLVRFVLSFPYRSPPFQILPSLIQNRARESSTFVREDSFGKDYH